MPIWSGDSWDKSSPSNSWESRLTTKILAPRLAELANSTLRQFKSRLGRSEGMAQDKKLQFLGEFLLFRLEKGIEGLVMGLNNCCCCDCEQSKLAEGDCEII